MEAIFSFLSLISSLIFPLLTLNQNSLIFVGKSTSDIKVINAKSDIDSFYGTIYFYPKYPTVVYFHDWNDGPNATSTRKVIESFLFHGGYNILIADWKGTEKDKSYIKFIHTVSNVAHTYVEMFQKLKREGYDLEKLYLVGHGVGAHICGAIGRELLVEKNVRLERITGLDPVEHMFRRRRAYKLFGYQISFTVNQELSKEDARFVDIIHTNAGKIGTKHPSGDMDFWPNGGKSGHEGCKKCIAKYGEDSLECNTCYHNMSWKYYAESIWSSSRKFKATLCNHDATSYNARTCNSTKKAYMGYYANRYNYFGNYYLNIGSCHYDRY